MYGYYLHFGIVNFCFPVFAKGSDEGWQDGRSNFESGQADCIAECPIPEIPVEQEVPLVPLIDECLQLGVNFEGCLF